MAAFVEGTPCWADVMLPDLAAGRRFYGEVFGWTFGEADQERHGYSLALLDGRPAAALLAKPDGRMPTAWNVHFASGDVAATAERIRAAGGEVLMGPGQVGEAGHMLTAADPSGAVFGVWQGTGHPGFGVRDAPGSFCWTELNTRDPATADPFYRAVFGFSGAQIGSPGGDFDYEVWTLGDGADRVFAGGRLRMGDDVPAQLPPHFTLMFAVADCDAAVGAVLRLGGRVHREPSDSPHGRLAAVVDDQGAHFTVIDPSRATGRS